MLSNSLFKKSFLPLFAFFLIVFSANAQFRVIGYYPTWVNYPSGISSVDLSKLTHVNIAFANPNSSGTPIPANGTNADVTTIVTTCHAKGVKVFLSIGGAGAPGSTYKTLFATAASTQSFVSKLTQYAITYGLDGIDVDIEGDVLGVNVTKAQYQSFVTYLGDSLHAKGKLMSAAMATWFGSYVTTTAVSQFDWISLMSYDASIPPSGPPAPHAPYSMMLTDFQYWNTTKGVPGSKINIGLPFYGYGWGSYANANNDEIGYCTIASTYSGAANTDSVGTSASGNVIYYNGVPTIKKKTDYALQNAGGVMVWELTEDCPTTSSNSLLLTIYDEIHPSTPKPTITLNNITKMYGDSSFVASATSNSTGAISYSIISGSSYASITSGGRVTIKGAGTATIQAIQAAATGYAADTVTATLSISPAALKATADNKTRVYNTANPTFTISYTGFVNGETSSVLTSAPTASTTATTTSNAGNYPITLTGGSAANYAITLVSGTLTVTKANPTLTYSGNTSGMLGTSINLSAASGSGGTISYTVSNVTGTAIVSGTSLNLTGVGTVTLTVKTAATTNYAAGTITQTITITAPPRPTINFSNITTTYAADTSFAVSASSNSPGSISYSIISGSSYASITSNGTVTITGAGTVTIQAIQAAVTGYSADTVTATLSINKSAGIPMQMMFPDSGTVGDTIIMSVLTNSTGAISYGMMNGDTNSANMAGNQLRLLVPGVFTIQIEIAGDSNYLPQLDTMQITILPLSVAGLITANASSGGIVVFPNPSDGQINIITPFNDDVTDVTVVNALGKQEHYSSKCFRTLMKGLLILKIKTNKGDYTTKVVTE